MSATRHGLRLPRTFRRTYLLQRTCPKRFYSSVTENVAPPQSQASSGAVLLSTRRLIELRGPQAPQFLQGLVSANITPWEEGHPSIIYSAFLNAQGRLMQDVFIYPIPKTSDAGSSEDHVFLIDVDANQIGNLARWLKKFKLRTKVSMRQIPAEEGGVLCTWSDSNTPDNADTDASVSSIQDPRVPGFGTRQAGSIQMLQDQWQNSAQYSPDIDLQSSATELQYQLRRYLFGIPEGQDELAHESAIIHDSDMDYMGAVDFRKGCYVGQELVIRTQHIGVVRKRIIPCALYDVRDGEPSSLKYDGSKALTPPPQGADVRPVSEGRKPRGKGKWLGGVGNVGLAMCRLEDMVGIGPTGEVAEGWTPKEWAPEWEGQSEEEKNLRVKAFVPSWWQQRIQKIKSGHVQQ